MNNVAPYKDFFGNELREGDEIMHPSSSERGTIVFLKNEKYDCDKWRVNYHDKTPLSRLCLQVSGKGMAFRLPN